MTKREGATGHHARVCPLLKAKANAEREMIQVPRETLEAMAEALSWAVAADLQPWVGPKLDQVIHERRIKFEGIQVEAENRSLALFENCLPLNFIHALSLEIEERGTL